MIHDRGELVVVDVRNGSTLPDLPPEVCFEVPGCISRQAIEPISEGPVPLCVRGLVQAVKAYEGLTIQAAINRDRSTAMAALMAHPLVGSYSKT
jgi:6-phospho-beta-glucosidase